MPGASEVLGDRRARQRCSARGELRGAMSGAGYGRARTCIAVRHIASPRLPSIALCVAGATVYVAGDLRLPACRALSAACPSVLPSPRTLGPMHPCTDRASRRSSNRTGSHTQSARPSRRVDTTQHQIAKKTSPEFAFRDTWAIFECVVSRDGLSTGSSGARDVRGATGTKAGRPALKNDSITTRPTVRIQA